MLIIVPKFTPVQRGAHLFAEFFVRTNESWVTLGTFPCCCCRTNGGRAGATYAIPLQPALLGTKDPAHRIHASDVYRAVLNVAQPAVPLQSVAKMPLLPPRLPGPWHVLQD